MPRKRTPSPELTAQDKNIAAGAALTLRTIGERHGKEKLMLAADLADAFANSHTPQPKPRTRKTKAAEAPPIPGKQDMVRDGKSAAANDDAQLAHHPV